MNTRPKPTIAELEALLNSEDDTPVTINADGSIGPQAPKEDDLCTAPGAADLTFGSLLCEMIRLSFTRVDGRIGEYQMDRHREHSRNDLDRHIPISPTRGGRP